MTSPEGQGLHPEDEIVVLNNSIGRYRAAVLALLLGVGYMGIKNFYQQGQVLIANHEIEECNEAVSECRAHIDQLVESGAVDRQ